MRSSGRGRRTAPRSSSSTIDPHAWTEGGAWWEVGVPEVSDRPSIRAARAALDEAKADQRRACE